LSRLPRVTAQQVVNALRRCGFEHRRSSGAHRVLVGPEGQRLIVPLHAGVILKLKTLQTELLQSWPGWGPARATEGLTVTGAPVPHPPDEVPTLCTYDEL
jgi:predicted RNA binding protein YcfA (HicA-like mRNA interferase family)